jgi:hypothetical protein
MAGVYDGGDAPAVKMQFAVGDLWYDVYPGDVRSIEINRGRPRPDQRMDAGQMIIVLDNHSGEYDPDNLGSYWVTDGVTDLAAGLPARIIAGRDGVTYSLYVGFLETTQLDAGFDATATMTFVDGISRLGNYTAPAKKTPTYSGETTTTRVNRMLTYANWPYGSTERSVSGTVTLAGTTQDEPIMNIIYQCEDAEAGVFYMSRKGVATFVNLQHKFSRPTQLSFNDVRSSIEVEYYNIKTTPGTYQLVNSAKVNYAPDGKKGKQKLFKNKISIAKYGLKVIEVNTYILKDAVANKLATYLAKKNAVPKVLVQEISFTAFALGDLWPDLLETELLDMCIVKRRTVDGRNQTVNLVIEGIRHKITPDDWDVTFFTSPVDQTRVILP